MDRPRSWPSPNLDFSGGVNERYIRSRVIAIGHGRMIRIGQVWQSSDPRRLRAVTVFALVLGPIAYVVGIDVVTRKLCRPIRVSNFTIGSRGWHLLKEAA